MKFLDRARGLIGRSAFAGKTTPIGVNIDDAFVVKMREMLGGNLSVQPTTQLEWTLGEVDIASQSADLGDLSYAARLCRAVRRDSVVAGLQTTKSGGVIRLPKEWFGDDEVVDELTNMDAGTPVFDLLCPPSELKAMSDDTDYFCISFGELVPVAGRPYPVLERKDPEHCVYMWQYDQWFFRSIAGLIPINPGDGRWVINYAGPRLAPWQNGLFHPVGRSWVRKDNMQALKDNWSFTLANAARVAFGPVGATEPQQRSWFRQIASWGINNAFFTPPGWDVKVVESNGRGWEGFDTAIKLANEDFMIALAGQLVSTTGGTGFSSEDLYAAIRYDLIQGTATPLAHTISTQVIPYYTWLTHPEKLEHSPGFRFKVQRPADMKAEAAILTALGNGAKALLEVAKQAGYQLDVARVFGRFGIDLTRLPQLDDASRITLTPSALAAVVTIDEARRSLGLSALGGKRGSMTIQEIVESYKESPDQLGRDGMANKRANDTEDEAA